MGLKMSDSRLPIIRGGAFRREDYEELRNQLEDLCRIPKRDIEFGIDNDKRINSKFPVVPQTPEEVRIFPFRTGEAFCGPPLSESAHIDLLIGAKNGPIDKAIKEALNRLDSTRSKPRIISNQPKNNACSHSYHTYFKAGISYG